MSVPVSWAGRLLDAAGLDLAPAESRDDVSPWHRWAASGGLALTGEPDGRPLPPTVDVASAAEGAGLALRAVAAELGSALVLDAPALLGARAAALALTRRGRVSAGGSTRLLPAGDAWICLGLRRPEDHDLVPALVADGSAVDPEDDGRGPDDVWAVVTDWAARTPAGPAVARARMLGLPAAVAGECAVTDDGGPPAPWSLERSGRLRRRLGGPDPVRVLDLSVLWAGPLAVSLLELLGAEVIRVESVDRPDPGRWTAPDFYRLLHGPRPPLRLDPRSPDLSALLADADVVVTSARRRALEQLGLTPRAGQTWVTVTGHGYRGPCRDAVAYGDDAAVAAGIVALGAGGPVFCADAVADPLTGLHAAVAAAASMLTGEAAHVDVSLVGVAGAVAAALPWAGEPPADLVASPPALRRPTVGPFFSNQLQ